MIMYVNTPNQGTLNLREKASTISKVLKKIPNGTKLECEDMGEWMKAEYAGEIGYVLRSYLSDQSSTSSSVTKEDLQKVYNGLKEVLKTIENILK